ncbi:MAG: PTS sugar transporter subunit IIA [Desulfobulbaceae bacterium]|nr:PTS sugar transporter subunit IIA [Desulfobulbaceae bacterium]
MLQLKEQSIILEMKAGGKEDALQELAAAVHASCTEIDPETVFSAVQERELVGSTGVGNGVAIPHAKMSGLDRLVLSFGRSRKGVNFEAIDNRPVHLFVQILSPTGMAYEYLQTLARISRLLKVEANRRSLLEAVTKQEILDIFNAPEPE